MNSITKAIACNLICAILLCCASVGRIHADDTAVSQGCDIATRAVPLDGGALYYNMAGSGPHIVLLHGLFAQKEQWNGVLCLLSAAGYAAIAPDLPGYGASVDFPLAVYKLENQVDLIRQFVDTLGVADFDLAGNSMGGAIAALYARRYPQQVRTLAFIGAPLGIVDWSPQVKEAFYRGVNPFIPVDVQQFDLEMSLLFVDPPPIPESVKEALVKNYSDNNRRYQQIWNIVNLYDTSLYGGSKIRDPTLIIWGMEDKIFAVEGADRLRHRIVRGKLVKLPDAGHLPLLENAEQTAAILVEFLKSYSVSRPWQR